MPEVNYLAILVCGIVSIVLGSLWYGPLFQKIWTVESGFDKVDPAKKEQMMKGMTKSYMLAFVGALVQAFVLSHLIRFSESFGNPEGLTTGLVTGFWVWLGFIATVSLSSILWEGKSWKLWGINNSYNLVQLLIFGAILSVWR